jgi:hypothetical protein
VNDRDFCNRAAALAAEAIREKFSHLHRGANDYSAFGPGIVLFFGNDDPTDAEGNHPVVAKLREYLAIEEVGIHELGYGTTKDHRSWALLAESRRDVDYCRRLVWKAFGAVDEAENNARSARQP